MAVGDTFRVAWVSMTSPLPEKAADTTAEQPWPVRVLSLKISDYVDRMSQLWVEGQVVQFNARGGTAFLTLRDPDVDMSLSVSVPMNAVNAMPIPLTQGVPSRPPGEAHLLDQARHPAARGTPDPAGGHR